MMDRSQIVLGDPDFPGAKVLVRIGNELPLAVIAGPCQIETLDHALFTAERLKVMCDAMDMGFVYKSSYDKANRTSAKTARGPGMVEGLRILQTVREKIGVPVTTDVHTSEEAYDASGVVDLVQIPALLSRQTDLITVAAATARALSIKKGQGAAPTDMLYAVAKALPCPSILIERGTTFGYGRLVNDMRGLAIMKDFAPVFFDATHSVQLPATDGGKSGGERWHVETLARAAVATGIAGVFIECHEDPDRAPSDGPCMVPLGLMGGLLARLARIDDVVKAFPS